MCTVYSIYICDIFHYVLTFTDHFDNSIKNTIFQLKNQKNFEILIQM